MRVGRTFGISKLKFAACGALVFFFLGSFSMQRRNLGNGYMPSKQVGHVLHNL